MQQRSNSFSSQSSVSSLVGGGGVSVSHVNAAPPASSPSSSLATRGSFSSAGLTSMSVVGSSGVSSSVVVGVQPVFTKRASIFAMPPTASVSIQAHLQKTLFNKMHEEVYTVLQVVPKVTKPTLDVLATFGVNNPPSEDQAYYLVLTSNNQVKKSSDGFGAPKLHWVKIKQPEHAGGEMIYNWKKSKLLKLLRRIEMSGTNMTSGGSTGSLRRDTTKEEFTLVFRSGDTDKSYSFSLTPSSSSSSSSSSRGSSTVAPSATGASTNSERSIFVWYALEICRSYCGFVPTSNIDTVLYQQLTNEITSFYLSEPPPVNVIVSNHLRQLLLSVTKNRTALADQDLKLLEKSKVDEKVLVPSMSAEETALVQKFLKQIEEEERQSRMRRSSKETTMGDGNDNSGTNGTNPPSSSGTSPGAPSLASSPHSHLHDLESFLLHKLTVIEHANIESLFDSQLERINARILKEDIQTNLLDNKLEEISLWINHHNLELSKMKKGVELIEKRNLTLDVAETNQQRLYSTLQSVLESFKLDPDSMRARDLEQALIAPTFDLSSLGTILTAVRRLDRVLQVRIEDGALEDLQSIKDQRQRYSNLRTSFTRHAETALDTIFGDVARKTVQELSRHSMIASASSSDNGGIIFQTNETIHRDLRRYGELVRYLERLESGLFLSLRSKYCLSMKQVYEVKLKTYFHHLRKTIAPESKDTHLSSFPDWSVEQALTCTRRTEGGRNVTNSSNVGWNSIIRQGPNAGLQTGLQNSKIRITHAFVQAMENLTPTCLTEEKFLQEFFGSSSSSSSSSAASSGVGVSTSRGRNSFSGNGSSGTSGGSGGGGVIHEDIRSMMSDLFRGLEHELKDLSSQASKMDHFYALELLVQCERLLTGVSGTASPTPSSSSSSSSSVVKHSCEFLETVLTSLSTYLKLSFTSFIDGEIEWITSLHPNSKRCGILQPMLKFPAIVDRMENIVYPIGPEGRKVGGGTPAAAASNTRSQAADTSYQKLASALFRWLDQVAKSDEKYSDVVYIENTHFFTQMFTTSHLTVPALEQFLVKADSYYREHMSRYVSWNIDYEMPLITKFWSKLEEQLKSIHPEDIPFAAELSKHDLRSISKGPLANKALQKSLTNVLKRIEKHMPKNPQLIQIVWGEITRTFLSKLSRFEQLVSQCYQNEKLQITQAEVADMFQQLLPPGNHKTHVTHTHSHNKNEGVLLIPSMHDADTLSTIVCCSCPPSVFRLIPPNYLQPFCLRMAFHSTLLHCCSPLPTFENHRYASTLLLEASKT